MARISIAEYYDVVGVVGVDVLVGDVGDGDAVASGVVQRDSWDLRGESGQPELEEEEEVDPPMDFEMVEMDDEDEEEDEEDDVERS